MTKFDFKHLPILLALLVIGELRALDHASAAEFPFPAAADNAQPTAYISKTRVAYHDGSFVGPVTSSYYGDVQVKVTIAGGRIVAVVALRSPSDRSTSRRINSVALPRLQSEVIQAQSARINGVTGATVTSEAYVRSVAKALEASSS